MIDEFLKIDKIDSEENQIIFVGDGIDAYEDVPGEAGLYRLPMSGAIKMLRHG